MHSLILYINIVPFVLSNMYHNDWYWCFVFQRKLYWPETIRQRKHVQPVSLRNVVPRWNLRVSNSNKLSLKLYCGYKYTRPYTTTPILGLKQLWLQMNGHAFFHYHQLRWYVSSGIRTQATPIHDRKVSALDRSATLVRYQVDYLLSNSILIYEYKWICDNTCMEWAMVWYPMKSSVNN